MNCTAKTFSAEAVHCGRLFCFSLGRIQIYPIFGFEGFSIYYTDGGRDILLGRYATQEKAEMVLGEMVLTYRDLIKGTTTRKHPNGKISEKFYMPQDN